MKKLLFLSICCWMFSVANSTAQQVKNVRIDADDEKVSIVYDLIPTGAVRSYSVCIRTSDPTIKPMSTTGAIGKNRSTGINQKIEWFFSSDGYTADQINNLKVEVFAIDPANPGGGSGIPAPKPKKIPVYAGLGAVSLAGAGLMVTGFTKRKDALDNYQIYKDNISPDAPIYTELGATRDEFYDETNKSNKKAQLLIYGGAAVFAAAGYILVNRIIWINRIEHQKKARAVPANIQCNNYRQYLEIKTVSSASAGAGFGLTLHF